MSSLHLGNWSKFFIYDPNNLSILVKEVKDEATNPSILVFSI